MKKLLLFFVFISSFFNGNTQVLFYSDFSGWGTSYNIFTSCQSFDHLSVGLSTPYSASSPQWHRIGTPSQTTGTSDVLLVAGNQRTEGLFTDFNFIAGYTYKIHFGVKNSFADNGATTANPLKISVFGTTNLQQTPDPLIPNCQEEYLGLPSSLYWYFNQATTSPNTPFPLITFGVSANIPFLSSTNTTISDRVFFYTPAQFNSQIAFFNESNLSETLQADLILSYIKIELDRKPDCIPDFTYSINTNDPNTVTFTPISTTSAGYTWSWGDGSPAIATTGPASVVHHYNGTASYNVTLTLGGGHGLCSKRKTICIDGIEIQSAGGSEVLEGDPPPPDYVVHPTGCDANFGVSINTQIPNTVNVIPNSPVMNTYVWDFGDGTPTQPIYMTSHAYAVPGSYKICLTTMLGTGIGARKCTQCMSVCVSDFGNEDQQIPEGRKMSSSNINGTGLIINDVYPNPVTSELNVNVNSASNEVSVKIYDVMGRTVSEKTYTGKGGAQTLKLNIENLNNGVYIVEVTDHVTTFKRKIIKE